MSSLVKDWNHAKKLVERLLSTDPCGSYAPLTHVAREIQGKNTQFQFLLEKHKTPFYAFDSENLEKAATRFKSAFSAVKNTKFFYAVKVNHYPPLLSYLFSNGFGADVSSSRELKLALAAGAQEIVFSGPGKTVEELQTAIEQSDKVVLNIDSFGELAKLRTLLSSVSSTLRAGVRVSFQSHGSWGKFGIPLERLCEFIEEAKKIHNLSVIGVQFHISWNEDSAPYENAIQELSGYLKNAPKDFLESLTFIDIGGGFRPYMSEGYYPEDTPLGAAIQGACDQFDEEPGFKAPYFVIESVSIEEYAKGISNALQQHLSPLGSFQYWIEPGRIICNDSMHVVLRIEDVKSDQCIITDGGTNIIGFERFEFDYFPIINLTHPSLTEIECTVYGSLCMPQDYWGHRLYASKVSVGDILIVPYQGALTYANMQSFIKGEVPVYALSV